MLGLMKAYTNNSWSKEMADVDPKKMKKINQYADKFENEKNSGGADKEPEIEETPKRGRTRTRAENKDGSGRK